MRQIITLIAARVCHISQQHFVHTTCSSWPAYLCKFGGRFDAWTDVYWRHEYETDAVSGGTRHDPVYCQQHVLRGLPAGVAEMIWGGEWGGGGGGGAR